MAPERDPARRSRRQDLADHFPAGRSSGRCLSGAKLPAGPLALRGLAAEAAGLHDVEAGDALQHVGKGALLLLLDVVGGDLTSGDALPPAQQRLRVRLDRSMRAGKTVTLVVDFVGAASDLDELGKKLKTHCGCGGSVKDGQILVQGDHAQRVLDYLLKAGYGAKRSGG